MRKSGEADLIIHHHVDGAPGAVGTQLRHLQGFDHYALSGHGGVTVNEHGKDSVAALLHAVLLRPNNSFEDTIDRFKV